MKIFLAILLCVLSYRTYSQDIKFSFNVEASYYNASDRSSDQKSYFTPVTDIFGAAKYNFDSTNSVNLKLGYKYSEIHFYHGPEFGIYYNLFLYNEIYGFTGIKALVTIPEKYNSHTVTYASAGLGYYLTSFFSIEMLYNKPLKERFFSADIINSFIYDEFNFGIIFHLSDMNQNRVYSN